MDNADREPTYAEIHKGRMKAYRITSHNAKHWRDEFVNGGNEFIMYGSASLGGRTTILLTPADAVKLAHLGLVEVKEIASTEPIVHIPADWQELSLSDKKALIAQFGIEDAKTGTHARCNETIAAYIEARK